MKVRADSLRRGDRIGHHAPVVAVAAFTADEVLITFANGETRVLAADRIVNLREGSSR